MLFQFRRNPYYEDFWLDHDFLSFEWAPQFHFQKTSWNEVSLRFGSFTNYFSHPKVKPFWTRKHTPIRNHNQNIKPLKWGYMVKTKGLPSKKHLDQHFHKGRTLTVSWWVKLLEDWSCTLIANIYSWVPIFCCSIDVIDKSLQPSRTPVVYPTMLNAPRK